MTDLIASVAGLPCQELVLEVPEAGVWFADALLAEASEVTGRVEVVCGSTTLSGTVDPTASGSWEAARRVRVVAGGNGWGKPLGMRAYHSDIQVRALTVAQDAANAAGETMGTFQPVSERLGVDFVRRGARPASEALELAAGGVPWWVDYQGVTHVAARTAAESRGAYRLLTFDTRSRIATISADDPAAVGIGTVLTDRLSEPQTVRGYRVIFGRTEHRIECWCGGEPGTESRAARALEAIARHAAGARLHGRYRYRVTAMVGDRYQVDPVRKDLGLPAIGPLSARPGLAGGWASVARGTEVVVSFLDDGDPAWPCIDGFAPKGDDCFVPASLELCVAPGEDGKPVAGLGDTVSIFFPPTMPVTGTLSGAPFVGTLTITENGVGIIDSGSSRVRRGD